jgi:hypothetical protein
VIPPVLAVNASLPSLTILDVKSITVCGRYRRNTREDELARQYSIPIPPQLDLPISYNIASSQNVLVIRFNPKTGPPIA